MRTVPYALAPNYRHSGPRKGSHYTRRPSTKLPSIPPPAARSVPKIGQKTQDFLEKQSVFWYNESDTPLPSRFETWGHPCEFISRGGHRCHAREGVKMGGLQYSSRNL